MKKIVLVLLICFCGLLFTQCNKNKYCSCKEYKNGAVIGSKTYGTSYFDVKSCDDLEIILDIEAPAGVTVRCSELD